MANDNYTLEEDTLEQIAVIGLAGRFPGAKNIDQFWQNLRDGVESIVHFTDLELEAQGLPSKWLNDPNYVKAGTVLEDFDKFDAPFFGYSPKEAEHIDPQQRIFLETAWEALENAGYNPGSYDSPIGVFAGSNPNNYVELMPTHYDPNDVAGEMEKLIGNEKDFLCTRVSYKLNLKGPSLTIQTGCSTSLVAVQLACQSLLNYQSSMALAGGVSVNLKQNKGYFYQEGTIVSPDGRCRAFDVNAQGTVLGQGVGVVVLKRLSEALSDGDTIHAVIKGAAINNDGGLKAGYTAPSVDGQAEVIAMAQALSGVPVETISYIEAHGTGTSLGDPIEIAALTQAFRAGTKKNRFCAVGSVKTNIGHTDAAAGIAGLIKTILMFNHKQIPENLHFEKPNPNIDFENTPFYVPTELSDWKAEGYPRRAGVSSFGIGGTNAHVVLEEAPMVKSSGHSRPWQLVLLSAKTGNALDIMTTNLAVHLKQHPEVNLADVAYTLQVGRKLMPHRRMVVCRDRDDALTVLNPLDAGLVVSAFQEPVNRDLVFMFSGQGAQYINMGLELYHTETLFCDQIDRCAEILKPALDADIRDILYPTEDKAEDALQMLTQTAITQPALFTIEYALARLWMSWGVQPAAMVGHSIGEYVAACLAGVFSLEDALKLVAARGRLMQELPQGSMLAVGLSENEIQPFLDKNISLAAINGASLCVVSGETEAVGELEKKLSEKKVTSRPLHTSHAFHSPMMAPIVEEFAEQVKQVRLSVPQIRFISNVTGSWITADEATDPGYWARHLRLTVRFADGLGALMQESERIFLEVGPGHTLTMFARQHPAKTPEQQVVSSLRHPKEQKSDVAVILNTLGRLWLSGTDMDWAGFYAQERRIRLPLPTYPFERQRYWISTPKQAEVVQLGSEVETMPQSSLPQYKNDIIDWFYVPSWTRSAMSPSLQNETRLEAGLLVFMDKCGLGALLVQRFVQDGADVTTVEVGEAFAKISDSGYTLNPHNDSDYVALLDDLRAMDRLPSIIIHLWNLTRDEPGHFASRIDRLDDAQNIGLYSLLALAQALGKQAVSDEYPIEVISNNIHEVTGEELLCPEKATLLGPCKVIPLEYSNITCRNIDVYLPDPDSERAVKLVDQLLTEFDSRASDTIVAYRGNHRWIPTVVPVQMDDTSKGTERLRDEGVYLILGGLGGIGLVLAEHLAKTVKAKLILTGRKDFPAQDDWDQWLQMHDEDDETSQKIRKLLAIEAFGVEILVFSADVANLDQMQEVIKQAIAHFGQINGVIHAAGVFDGEGAILKRTRKATESVLASKVKGTLVLDEIFSDSELDFFILFSSIATELYHNMFGQVGYVAANSFLDAFAYCTTLRTRTSKITINWTDWQLVGMSVRAEKQLAKTYGINEPIFDPLDSILPTEGIDLFGRVLNNSFPRVIISTRDLGTRIKLDAQFSLTNLVTASLSTPSHSRPNLSNTYVAASNQLEKTIAEIWEELLGIEQVGIYDDYIELGGDSLRATQFIARLSETFQVEMPLQALFETPTIKGMAETIEALLWAAQGNMESSEQFGTDLVEGEI